MSKHKILYLVSGKNGIAGFTRRELELLHEKGIDPFLCLTQLKKDSITKWDLYVFRYVDIVKSLVVSLPRLIAKKMMLEALQHREIKSLVVAICFYHITKDKNLKAVHVQMGDHKLSIGYYLSRLHGLPLSTTIHAHELYFKDIDYRFQRYVFLLHQCRQIFTISDFNKQFIHQEFGIELSQIVVMRLYPSFLPTLTNQTIKLLVVGNWEKKKGYEELIKAVELLKDHDLVVYVAGTNVNPDVDLDLYDLVKEHGVEHKFIFMGKVRPEILEILYRFCDLFILPSKTEYYSNGRAKEREGIPVALMEAISFGMPVITTKHAGIPELVDSIIIQEGDYHELASSIKLVIANLKETKEQVEKNMTRLKHSFTEKNVEVLASYFKSLDKI